MTEASVDLYFNVVFTLSKLFLLSAFCTKTYIIPYRKVAMLDSVGRYSVNLNKV
jgi:hypothetical protein